MVARGGLACSRLRRSRFQEIEKAREHENKTGGKLGEKNHVVSLPLSPFLSSATAPFFPDHALTISVAFYLRVIPTNGEPGTG